MPNEFTTVAMTYNLWGRNFWDKRSAAVRALFTVREPDILGVQELCEESRDLLDEVMNRHTRVEDDFPGWTSGSNIWWRADLYHLEAHGTEDIGTHPLFWVKLNPLSLDDAQPLTFATAHYTWPGNPEEERSGLNPRLGQARRTVEALDRLAADGPCIFVGDLNEEHHPARILRSAGFRDSFSSLGCGSPITSPPVPMPAGAKPHATKDIPKVLDYQFHRGPLRVRSSEVVDFFHEQIPPSDHKPVVATYTLGETEALSGTEVHRS